VKKKRAEEYKQHNTKSLYNKSHPGLTALFDSQLEMRSTYSTANETCRAFKGPTVDFHHSCHDAQPWSGTPLPKMFMLTQCMVL